MENTKVEDSYSGTVFPEDGIINEEWIKKIMEEMKSNKFIHKKYLLIMISKVKEYFEKQKSLVDVNIPRYHFLYLHIAIKNSMSAVMFMGNIMTFLIFSMLMDFQVRKIHIFLMVIL